MSATEVRGTRNSRSEFGFGRMPNGTKLVPLAGSSAGVCCDSMAALGDRGAGAGFGVKPRENEEGRGGVAATRSGAKRRPDFWRAALGAVVCSMLLHCGTHG